MITPERVLDLIARGEGEQIEFKSANGGLPQSAFETIGSFLNKNGGTLLLGVDDDGKLSGLAFELAEQMAGDIVNLSNNPKKISPPFVLDSRVVAFPQGSVVAVEVPSSSQVHKVGDLIFDRSRDGDFQLRTSEQIRQLYLRKNDSFSENKIYPYVTAGDLDESLIRRTRQRMLNLRPDHPWRELTNDEFFRSAGLYRKDFSTGAEGFTLAAVMLFGRDVTILNVVPYFKIDALLRRKNCERYDDRITIQTNLLDTFDLLMKFVGKHLPDPFYLEGTERRSLRDTIFRELLVNFLIHREYANAHHATFCIEKDFAETRNANKPRFGGSLTLENYEPYRKNPVIARIFTEIGLAEELGTGMRKISKYIREYAKRGGIEFFDEELFRARLPIPPEEEKEESDASADQEGHSGSTKKHIDRDIENAEKHIENAEKHIDNAEKHIDNAEKHIDRDIDNVAQILEFCREPKSSREILTAIGLKYDSRTLARLLTPLLKKGLLARTIPEKPTSRNQHYITVEHSDS